MFHATIIWYDADNVGIEHDQNILYDTEEKCCEEIVEWLVDHIMVDHEHVVDEWLDGYLKTHGQDSFNDGDIIHVIKYYLRIFIEKKKFETVKTFLENVLSDDYRHYKIIYHRF